MINLERKYLNADGDLATINASISEITNLLNEATALLTQAESALAICRALPSYGKLFSGFSDDCVEATGRHYSTWVDQYNTYAPIVKRYQLKLEDLLNTKAQLTKTDIETAQSANITAQAQKALADADAAKTGSAFLKYALIIGGIAIVVIGGIFAWKKLKKQ